MLSIPGNYFKTPLLDHYEGVVTGFNTNTGYYSVYFPPIDINYPGVKDPKPETWTLEGKSLEECATVL